MITLGSDRIGRSGSARVLHCRVEEGVVPSLDSVPDDLEPLLLVRHDGYCKAAVPVNLKISCPMDMKRYPFDDQECPLLFGEALHSKFLSLQSHYRKMQHTRKAEWARDAKMHEEKRNKIEEKGSPAGNRTPVSRVTGGDTHNYTTEDSVYLQAFNLHRIPAMCL